jgi:hypothetical protein
MEGRYLYNFDEKLGILITWMEDRCDLDEGRYLYNFDEKLGILTTWMEDRYDL